MEEIKSCPLCKTKCEAYSFGALSDHYTVVCSVCGKYNISNTSLSYLDKHRDNFHIISGVLRNFYELHKDTDEPFVIKATMFSDDSKFQAKFLNKAPKNVSEKAALLLQYIARKSNFPSEKISVLPAEDYPICFCKNAKELIFFINHIRDNGDIKVDTSMRGDSLSLTVQGWQKIESLKQPNIESKQAFVAMWFDESLNEAFEKGICPLGDEKDKDYIGFKMLRIDQKEFNDKICDHIIAEIKQSRFMIADCTGLRHAVFYEAGFAKGFGLPVIFTCKEGTNIKQCFDTDHEKHIMWKDADDLRNKLKDRILATIGKA